MMKFPAMFAQEAPGHRDEAAGALSTFARWAAYACAGAAVLCLAAAVLLAVSALNRFPAAVPEVLSWVSVGEGGVVQRRGRPSRVWVSRQGPVSGCHGRRLCVDGIG